MLRNLSLVLITALTFWPASSFAVSMSGIRVQSALDEPFQANIDLNAADVDDLSDLKVNLASQQDFARAGIDRPYSLTKLKFSVIPQSHGRATVRVTSRMAVREPFLDFLIEANWSKGRLLKKYTILLDPRAPPQRESPSLTSPIAESQNKRHRVQTEASWSQTTSTHNARRSSGGKQYGPIRHGSTLSRIARALKASGVRAEQVARSLFRNNPQAFVGNNINHLKVGAVLWIPDSDASLIRETALTKSNANESEYKHERSADRLHIASKPVDAGVANAPSDGSTPEHAGAVEQVRTDLMMVQETSESNRKNTEELRSRIKELESQLGDIRQLLKLKSDQLAQLQIQRPQPGSTVGSQASQISTPGALVTPLQSAPIIPITHTTSTTPIPQPVPGAINNGTAPLAINLPAQPQIPVTPQIAALPAQTPISPQISGPVSSSHQLQKPSLPPVQVPSSIKPKTPSLSQNDEDWFSGIENWFSKILADPLYQAIIGGTLLSLLLGAGGFWWWKRRQMLGEEAHHEDSEALMFDSHMSNSGMMEDHSTSTLTKKPESPEETSFLSDFSPSNMQELQQETGEVDPAAEADVYIAYGRYQQAESLITQTLDRFPERLDLQFKLLEIYYTTRNVAAFTSLVENMGGANLAQTDPQAWEKVRSMGRELLPGHALFGIAERNTEPRRNERAATTSQSHELNMDELGGLDLNLDTVLSDMPSPMEIEALKSKSAQNVITAPHPSSAMSSKTLAFKDVATTSPKAQPAPAVAPPTPEVDQEFDLDFNHLDLSGLSTIRDVDLGALNLGEDSNIKSKRSNSIAQPSVIAKTNPMTSSVKSDVKSEDDSQIFNLDDLDLGSDIAIPLDISSENSPMSDQLDPNSSEEVENKLDLARVYMQIDGSIAKGIIEEVLKEGNPAQKAEAKKLLAKMG